MALFDDASLVTTPNGYKAGTLYSIKPTSGLGDMTVVRATTATRVNSAGLIESVANNVPRLDYSNGSCPSLLVEPQRTNLALYSEQFDNAAWQNNGPWITPNTTTAPDGTLTADTLAASQAQNNWQAINASINTTYTLSLYVKLGTATNLCLIVNNQSAWNTIGGQSFNSANGLNTSTWTRISYTFTTPSTLPFGGINFHIGGNAETGLTQSTGTVFIWGAQLELGSYPTSYIPTTSAAVTRNADVISKTGISSLIGQTEGTVFVEVDISNTGITRIPIVISSANPSTSTSEAYFYINGAGNLVFEFYTAGIAQCSISAGAIQVGVQKLAFVYKNNDFAFYRNGTQVGVDTSGTVASGLDRLYLGCFTNNGLQLNDRINSAVIFPTRLTNSELAQLTTL